MAQVDRALTILAVVLLATFGSALATLPSLVTSGKADLALATTGLGHSLARHNQALEIFRIFLHEQIGGDIPLEHFALFTDVLNVQGRSTESYRQLYKEAGQGLDEMGIVPLNAKDLLTQESAPDMYISLIRNSGRLGQTLGLAQQPASASEHQTAISVWEIVPNKYPILRSIQRFNRIPLAERLWTHITYPLHYSGPRPWPWEEARAN